MLQTYGKN